MPQIDCSLYVTVRNKSDRPLVNGIAHAGNLGDSGKWIDFPSSIPAHGSSSFKVVETAWFTGTLGTFTYEIVRPGNEEPYTISGFQHNAYTGMNEIVGYSTSPTSEYILSFVARVGGGEWMQDSVVPTSGHPLYVVYTFDSKRMDPYQYRFLEISALTTHPVRNSRGDLITGYHTLWDYLEPSAYPDGDRGSLAPNIFGSDFSSEVSESGVLYVTVQVIDRRLLGSGGTLYGATPDGKRVILSHLFVLDDDSVTVEARVIDAATSTKPFSLNADIEWGMELWSTPEALELVGPAVMRLELYWIGNTLHPAFAPYVPVTFLRKVLEPNEVTAGGTNSEFYQDMTRRVFSDYHKRYDTEAGASWFGVGFDGGNFHQASYLEGDSAGTGTFLTTVNCMDQAAMLELSCSLLGVSPSTSWLHHAPFGYINTTHLVGIKKRGSLVNVNNPFLWSDIRDAEVDIDNDIRYPFGQHVYIGHSSPWGIQHDIKIYDACSGPHLGTETAAEYITNCVDTETNLYGRFPERCTRAGTIDDIIQRTGVTSIDASLSVFQQRRTMPTLTPQLSRLVNTAAANTVASLAHVGWVHLPTWLKATLGEAWDVGYKHISVSETGAQALWVISNTNVPNSIIRVHVNVASVAGKDGNFDMEQSVAVMKDDIGSILMSTERQNIWTSGTLPGIEGVSLQYTDHVAAGRIVLVAGNVVMDIAGMTSYEELLPYALKLLNRTVRRNPDRSAPVIPVIQRQAIRMGTGTITVGGPETAAGTITVTGINARFSLIFSVSCKISAANAGSEGHGVLFDREIVEEVDNGEGCSVEFRFVTRKVGRHRVRVCVADLETMVGANLDMEVEVVGA